MAILYIISVIIQIR